MGRGRGCGGGVIPLAQTCPAPGPPQLVVGVALLVGPELGQDHLEDPHEDEQVDLGGGDRAGAHRAQHPHPGCDIHPAGDGTPCAALPPLLPSQNPSYKAAGATPSPFLWGSAPIFLHEPPEPGVSKLLNPLCIWLVLAGQLSPLASAGSSPGITACPGLGGRG